MLLLDAAPVVDGFVAVAVGWPLGDVELVELEGTPLVDELGLDGPLDDGDGVWPGDTVPEASDLLVVEELLTVLDGT